MCSRVSQSSQYSLVKGLINVSNITTHARAREDAKLLHTVERRRFIDELRHQKTRQGAFDKAMWHLDHPIPGTSCVLVPSDHGAGAKAIRYLRDYGNGSMNHGALLRYMHVDSDTFRRVIETLQQSELITATELTRGGIRYTLV